MPLHTGAAGAILRIMQVTAKKLLLLAAFCTAASSARADEIKLKDGKKLYGVIVGFEDNMFRVKTDFGFVLVEKDKIASIVPVAPGEKAPKPMQPKNRPRVPQARTRRRLGSRQRYRVLPCGPPCPRFPAPER